MSFILHIGPMRSGKTTAVIQHAIRSADTGLRVLFVTSPKDQRETESSDRGITSHNSGFFRLPEKIRRVVGFPEKINEDLVCVDEIQFFPPEDIEKIRENILSGKHFCCAGLNGDFRGRPFPAISNLLPIVSDVIYHHAFCQCCLKDGIRREAHFNKKIAGDPAKIEEAGGDDMYLTVCREHFVC